VDYFISCAVFVVCIFVVLFLALAYINRLIEIRIAPIAKRLAELEDERREMETRYTALQKLYQNLQSHFDELLTKYNLLQVWAEGVIRILCALGQEYPPPPAGLEIKNEKRYNL